jgi:hypothetical protein
MIRVAIGLAGLAVLLAGLAWWQFKSAQSARTRAAEAEARVAVQRHTIAELQTFLARQRAVADQAAEAAEAINDMGGGDAFAGDYLHRALGRVQQGAHP